MDADKLVQMANQIGQFFESQPDHAQALQGIASHIAKFWAPPMRQRLAAHLSAGGEGLRPIVIEALTR
jgi:formate dehydrogenase subunit delta